MQNIEDWALILGILLFVLIDLILLLLNTIISETTEPSRKLVLVPNKENPRTVEGVRIHCLCVNISTNSPPL